MGLLVELLRDARRVLDAGQAEASDRRRLDARRFRRADRCTIPASSRRTACRPGRRSRTPRRSSPRTRRTRRRPNEHEPQQQGLRTPTRSISFALAAASLRQAMQDMPEITEISKHIMIEETKHGLNIEIVDQDGRSMFPDGAKEPYERTRRIVQKLAAPLKALPNRSSITGHTAASRRAAAAGLRAVGTFRRPRQRGAPDPRGRGPADGHILHGGRKGRHPAAVPRRSATSRPTAASPSR